jgi:5-methylcytosine-specific restriction endonuclease McrA
MEYLAQEAVIHTVGRCQLCERPVGALTVHHLVPRSQVKQRRPLPTALLCAACHRQLHTLFSNRQLARELASVEELKNHPKMQNFLCWIKKQDPNKRIKVRR